jgi:glycerol kinase
MQFQADLLGVDVVRPALTETTALGAAFLAGLAVGMWRDIQHLETLAKASGGHQRTFTPQITAAEREQRMQLWKKAVGRSLDWLT